MFHLLALYLFFTFASVALTALAAKRRKLPPAQPFQIPIVPTGTRIPVLYGTWRVAPIITWVGAVRTTKVFNYTTPTLGPIVIGSPQATPVGYEYSATLQGVLCWGKAEVSNMIFGGTRLLSEQSATQTLKDPSGLAPITLPAISGGFCNPFDPPLDLEIFHGGTASGVIFLPTIYGEPGFGGGVKGAIIYSMGSRQYGPNGVLVAALGAANVPSYADMATVVYDDLVLGESPTPPLIEYVLRWGGVPVNGRNVGPAGRQWFVEDTSAAAILIDALTNAFFGLKTPAWQINTASFDAAHDQLFTEALGQSMLAGSSSGPTITTFQQLREECERTAGGVLRRNPETFQWEFKLLRDEAADDAAFNALPHYDEDDFSSLEWQRTDPREVINAVTVEFSDAEWPYLYQTNTVTLRNDANIAMTGSVRPITNQYLSVTSRETALQLCARDLKQLSTPLARGQGKATRALWRASLGDCIRISNIKHQINDVVVRVMAVDLGMPEDATITVDLVEDVFGHDDIVRTGDPTPPVLTFPKITRPVVTAISQSETDGVGTLAITVLDPEHRIVDISFKRKVGADAESAWDSVASASPDTSDPTFPFNDHVTSGDLNGTHTYTVTLSAVAQSTIRYRVQFISYQTAAAPLDDLEEITGLAAFRQLPVANVILVEADPIVWDVTGTPIAVASVTLTASHTLDVVGEMPGLQGTLLVTTAGSFRLTLPSNSVVKGSGETYIDVVPGHNKITVTYDGARFWWNYDGVFSVTAHLEATLAGHATLTANLAAAGAHLAASLAGSATLTANLSASVQLAAALSATATLTTDLSTGGGGPGFLTMTIAHGMFPSTQTDIEVWFSFTNNDLKTVANGGHVVNANHRRFASDSPGTSLHKYDIVTPTATTDSTGLIEGWVLVPSGSSSVDTVLYLAYSDNGITTYQGDRAGMWARKSFANHGSDGTTVATDDLTGTITLVDDNTPTAVAGKLGAGAVHFVAASSQDLRKLSGTIPTTTNIFTLSAWVKMSSTGAYMGIVGKSNKTTDYHIDYILAITDTAKAFVDFTQGGNVFESAIGASSLSSGTWYYVVGTYDGATLLIYLNGVQDGTLSISGNVELSGGQFGIGRYGGINENFMDGDIDEPRTDMTHADSADRILAQYRNQSAPGTYITVA